MKLAPYFGTNWFAYSRMPSFLGWILWDLLILIDALSGNWRYASSCLGLNSFFSFFFAQENVYHQKFPYPKNSFLKSWYHLEENNRLSFFDALNSNKCSRSWPHFSFSWYSWQFLSCQFIESLRDVHSIKTISWIYNTYLV